MFVEEQAGGTVKRSAGQVYEFIEPVGHKAPSHAAYHRGLPDVLEQCDEQVYRLVEAEYDRLQNTLQLIAAENQCSRAVLAALGHIVQNKTTEGFVGRRFHGGCEVVDGLEQLAIDRANEVFGAQYANVQPHSGTSANQIVLTALLDSGDRILSLAMDQGGHVSHGAQVAFAGKFFEVEQYRVDRESFLLDYEAIAEQARRFRPKLLICGASAYARIIDFERFRAIADEVGAYLMADISHISSLIAAGVHPSPIDAAHFTTTSTYKPGGPRGGLILMGRDAQAPFAVGNKTVSLCERIEKATFPGFQGTPYLNNIAAKAVFFREMLSDEYQVRQAKIVENAQVLAEAFDDLGYDVLTGGTDNHMFLINVAHFRDGLTGLIAQHCLEDCGIIINMNRLPYDTQNARVTSGMRLGTPIVTRNGMGQAQMEQIARLVDNVLRGVEIVDAKHYCLNEALQTKTRQCVRALCTRFPLH
ncbi:MAG: serine hydroxymethyltransferase [Phycisphaerales bacterium]|nr:MAG: serine hydroxymethyltransferase [Phycisphaerales bacterium]